MHTPHIDRPDDGSPAARVPDRRRVLGATGEQLATEHLQRRGFEILDRNFRTRWGELDIVAASAQALVFCEVKTLQVPAGGRDPLEAITPRKRAQVRRMAAGWLAQRSGARPRVPELRFDAIGILLDADGGLLRLDHIEGAF